MSESELTAIGIGIFALLCAGVFGLIRWVDTTPVTPDPWDQQVAAELAHGRCTPICPNCLTEHDASLHLCPRCGAGVGAFTSVMPPLFLEAIGQVFRARLDNRRRHSITLNVSYFFAAFAAYGLVAPLFFLVPLYWGFLIIRLCDTPDSTEVEASHPTCN